jgi:hypothetical protein
MAPYNHLKDIDRYGRRLALAYGRHIGTGFLEMSSTSGGSPYINTLRFALSEGPIQGIEGVWFDGTGIKPDKYTLYDGTQTTAPSAPFAEDQPHYRTAMVHVELPEGLGEAEAKDNPDDKLAILAKFLKVEDYDNDGTPLGASYSASPARVIGDLVHTRGMEPLTRTNWDRWTAWRDYMATSETQDYSALTAAEGVGLKAEIWDDTNFGSLGGTLKVTRIDPTPYFESGPGSPAVGVPVDGFSVRWTGKILSKGAGLYTFSVTHDDGARLWVNNVQLVNEWSNDGQGQSLGTHTGTITLAADTLYDFKLEWNDGGDVGQCQIHWTPPSESSQFISQEYFYPVMSGARYEAHALFENETGVDAAMRRVLLLSNSIVQDADGKRNFYCLDELTTPTFDFSESNIREDTFKYYRRDLRDVPNHYEGNFRNLNAQYLQAADPPARVDFDTIQNETGVIISQVEDLDNMTLWQAIKVLKSLAKRGTEMTAFAEFDGTAITYPVLPGDLVTITYSSAGWTDKKFLVIEAIDYSPESTPDRRHFICLEWDV